MIKHFFFSCAFLLHMGIIDAQKTTLQEVTKICEGLTASEKPILVVMPFKIAVDGTNKAMQQ